MTQPKEASTVSLEETVDAQVFGGGVYHFHRQGEPNHKPIETQDGDTELMLQGMIVRLPEEPILINGAPYNFEVDDTRLTHAVNVARTSNVVSRGRWEPRMLAVSLGDSLPRQIDDSDDAVRSYPFDRENCSLNVVMPTEVTQSSTKTEELVSKVETAANGELALGLEQIDEMKYRNFTQRFKDAGWLAVYGAVGAVAASEVPNSLFDQTDAKVILGGMVAYLVGIGGMITKQWHRDRKFGDQRPITALVHKSYDAAVKRTPSLEEPIISLVPAEEEPEPQVA